MSFIPATIDDQQENESNPRLYTEFLNSFELDDHDHKTHLARQLHRRVLYEDRKCSYQHQRVNSERY